MAKTMNTTKHQVRHASHSVAIISFCPYAALSAGTPLNGVGEGLEKLEREWRTENPRDSTRDVLPIVQVPHFS